MLKSLYNSNKLNTRTVAITIKKPEWTLKNIVNANGIYIAIINEIAGIRRARGITLMGGPSRIFFLFLKNLLMLYEKFQY